MRRSTAANAGLVRVLADDETQHLVGQRDRAWSQPVRLDLFRHEIALRDAELLVLGVTGERDHVHPVEQRRRDRVDRVRRADEEDLRQVERQVEVVVAERRVLLRVEHLEHRARRIAADVGAHLVDLVDEHHRVRRLRVAQRADDRSRHCADVRAPMAADLRLVAHAADRQAHELPLERARDRLPERRLADARRADEAEDLPGGIVAELRDREMLDDPVLHLLEVVVILVEHRARAGEIEVVRRRLPPRQRRDPVDVRANDAVLRRGGRQPLEPRELALRGLRHFLGQFELGDALAQLVHLCLLRIGFAELLLDRLQLLAEEELTLALVELRLHLRLDLRTELEHLELAVEDRRAPRGGAARRR